MSEEPKPANQNHTFRALLRNPKRERAEEILMQALEQMQTEEIDRALIIRNFFEYFFYTLGQTADGTGFPTDIEHAENIAIVEEVDERWTRLRDGLRETWPDLFSPHS